MTWERENNDSKHALYEPKWDLGLMAAPTRRLPPAPASGQESQISKDYVLPVCPQSSRLLLIPGGLESYRPMPL